MNDAKNMKNLSKLILALCIGLCLLALFALVHVFALYNSALAAKYYYTTDKALIASFPPLILLAASLYFLFGKRYSNITLVIAAFLHFGSIILNQFNILMISYVSAEVKKGVLISATGYLVVLIVTIWIALSKKAKDHLKKCA